MWQIRELRAKSQGTFICVHFCYVIPHIGRDRHEIVATPEQKIPIHNAFTVTMNIHFSLSKSVTAEKILVHNLHSENFAFVI
jgi:hypothetical protein